MADFTCLADGMIVPADFEKTGLNLNEIVVGPTGCGKSFSNAYSRLLHTDESSVVVPIAKKAIKEKFSQLFLNRGYEVLDLNFAQPQECQVGYDPLDYVHSDEDVIQLARNLIGSNPSSSRTGAIDPYWNDSATSVLAAEIALIMLQARDRHKRPCFAEVIELQQEMQMNGNEDLAKTNIDWLFDAAEKMHPGNQATELWKTVKNLASRTASCIFSIVNGAVDKVFSKNVVQIMRKKRYLSVPLAKRR